MALPVSLPGYLTPTERSHNLGPFMSSTGNIYIFGVLFDNVTNLPTEHWIGAWKATDPTSSFSVIDQRIPSAVAANSVGCIDCVQDGDTIHIVFQVNASASANSGVGSTYRDSFYMNTDNFDFGGATRIFNPTDDPDAFGCSIGLRNDGDLVYVFSGENPANMGGTNAEVWWAATGQSAALLNRVTLLRVDEHYRCPTIFRNKDGFVGNATDDWTMIVHESSYGPTTMSNRLIYLNNTYGIVSVNSFSEGNFPPKKSYQLISNIITQQNGEQVFSIDTKEPTGSNTGYGLADYNPAVRVKQDTITDSGLDNTDDTTRFSYSWIIDTDPTTGDDVQYYLRPNDNGEVIIRHDGGDAEGLIARPTWVNPEGGNVRCTTVATTGVTAVSGNLLERDNNIVAAMFYNDAGSWFYDEYIIRAATETHTGEGGLTMGGASLAATGLFGLLEHMRPSADTTINGWTDELDGVVNIYLSINEDPPDDADYIKSSGDPVTEIYRCALTDPASAVSRSGGNLITYRYRKQGGATANLVVRLIEGASTVIATWTHNGVTTGFVQVSQSLTQPQIDSIVDYADLSLEFEADVL